MLKLLLPILLLAASCAPLLARAQTVPTTDINYDQAKSTPWLLKTADPTWTPREELLFQLVSGADVATTISSGRLPGVVEEGAVPVKLFGHHPNATQDIEFGIGRGLGHLFITKLMQHFNAPNWLMVIWQAGTISSESIAVAGNTSLLANRN